MKRRRLPSREVVRRFRRAPKDARELVLKSLRSGLQTVEEYGRNYDHPNAHDAELLYHMLLDLLD